MYPNYSKAFLDLKDVFVKKVIQADSFLKIFIETKPSEQICPCCGCKTKRVHDFESRKLMILRFKENLLLWFFANGVISVPPAVKDFWNTILFFLPITAEQGDWLFMLSLSFGRHFRSSRFHSLLEFLSQRSVDFWIPSIMHHQINYLRLFPLMSLKAMPLLENISVSSLILKNTGFWIFFQTALRGIWLITGETLPERKG